ncbi:IgGFc-binding protein-like isoform X1 [Styela clava]
MSYGKTTVMGPVVVGIVIYIIVAGIGEGAGNVQATHFRGGSISWKPSDSFSLSYREVIFTFKLGWRLSRIGCDERTITSGTLVGEDARWFCMFGCSGVVASTREKCTEFNLGEDWMFGSNTFKKVFEDDGPIEISYMECCWLTDLVVGAGGEWALTTTLNLGIRSDTGGPNSSPVTAMAPMITLRAGVPDVIDLAVRDSDGDKVTCRLGRHVGECGTICSLFSEFTLDEENCLIRYTPASNTTGKIPVAIMVEDHHRSNDGITMGKKNFMMSDALSTVPVQFIVVLKDPPKLCFAKPMIETSIPPEIPVKVRPGRNFTFTVTSTPCDATSSIDDFILIAPIGVRKSPILKVGEVYHTEITWTPEPAQDGSNLICVTGRSSNGVLSEQICITVEVPKATSFCAVVGGSHFITFDKARYNFYGMCKYQLIGTIPSPTAGLTPFSVLLANEETPAANTAVRIGTLEVNVYNQTVTIDGKRNVYLDGVAVSLPIRLRSGLRVEKSGRGINIGISLALRIHIDDGTLSVQLPQIYAGQVEGLCGNFNGESMDDLSMRGGIQIASNEAELAASFQIDEEGGKCNNGIQQLRDEPVCSESELSKAISQCGIITDKSDQGCFALCHDVIEPKNFYENCVNVLCQSADDFTALDVLVRAYADACQRESITVCDWRVQLGISIECEPNSHYERCAPTVPATCADSISTISPTPSDSCIEGCVCNKGYILSGSVCVPESECGCIINDIYYPKGFTYRLEGCERQCICGEGCKDVDPCSRRANCTKGTDGFHRCIEKLRNRATCKAVTDPHYQTFDGTKFDSMGTCAYVMVRSKRNATKATAFTVISVNEQSTVNANATHVKEVHVHFGDGHTLTFLRGPIVILDDKVINPGSSLHGVDVRRVGQFVVADFHFGIVVRWDGVDRLRITAWSPLRYMVEGLCGDFDDNPDNDFAVRPTEENLPDPGSFAESWRIEGYGTEGCFDHPGTEIPQPPCTDTISLAWYQEECRALTDPKGSFASCHQYVDPVKAARDCVYDLCAYNGNNTIKERTFASYTHDCLEESGRPQEWRDTEGMPQTCIDGTFNSCMEQCQPTCSDPTGSLCREKKPNRLGQTCVEGCVCADGLLLSGNECVKPEDCGCNVNGRYEKKGFTFAIADCTQTCVCQGPDNLNCGPTPGGCQLNRDRCQQRGDGYFECFTRPRRRATCKAVTDPHYLTFDGINFDSMGLCAYVMAKSKVGADVTPFRIVAVNEKPRNANETVSSVREVYAYIGDDIVIRFTAGPNVTVNSERVLAGTTLNGIEFRMVGRFFVVEFPFGLVIRWDGIDRLRIMAWARLKGTMEGLCGDFNDDQSNDFMTPEGTIVTEIDEFVNSWIEPGYQTEGCEDLPSQPDHFCGSDDQLQEYREQCKVLIDPDSPLVNCFEIRNPNSSYNDCVFDMCATDGDPAIRERIISSYTEDCREDAVSDEVPPGDLNFRTPEEEAALCRENSHFESCTSPCQATCTDKDGEKCLASDSLSTPCVDACVCDEGYVLSGDACIAESECGCEIEGRYVEKGFTYFNRNCTNECSCLGEGELVCTSRDGCPVGQRCRVNDEGVRGCIDHVRRRATCKAVTDPHYMTFDGVRFDSMGLCAYVMAKTKEDSGVTPFRIVAVNEKPKNVNETVSSVKEVFIYVGDDITIRFTAGPVVTVNGERVLSGTTLHDIEFIRIGRFFVAKFPFDLVVKWDGIDRLRIMAWASLKGTMEGVCGDFNDDQSNDFMTPDGTLVTEIDEFVNSWRVDGYETTGCEDPTTDTPDHFCGSHEQLEEYRRSCQLLIDPDSPLRNCFDITSPNSTFNDCVFDMCATKGDPAMRERIISSYTEDCREEAVSDEVPPGNLDFRTPEEEAALCSDNSHFENCVSPCQPTCNDKHGEKCITSGAVSTACVDTCVCDDGYLLSGDVCVSESECGCEVDGRYIEKGFTYNNDNCTVQCTCLGEGELVCTTRDKCPKGQRCRFNDEGARACVKHIRRRATCKAVTDPHYQTFDGVKFDSMGTCAYIMVRSKQGADVEKFRVVAVNEAPPENRIVSHVKEVHIDVGRDFRVSFSAGPVVKINGDVVLPGTKVRNVQIRKVGKFTVAEFDFGLVVRWDGIDRLRVMAWAKLKNKVEGLCGDFDDNPENDFTTPRGKLEPEADKFVRHWKINEFSEESCFLDPPPGTLNSSVVDNCERFSEYNKICSQLVNPDGSWKACHDRVAPESFYNDCIFDLCALGKNDGHYERIASEYTEDCLETEERPNTPNITEECPDKMISMVPMEQCQPTCDDPDASICKANNSLGDQPVSGCACNPGLVLSGSKCVTLEECGCLIDGKYREQGFRYLNSKCDIVCECVGAGDVVCLPTDPCRTTERCTKVNERYQCTPHIRNKATCKAITDPHYTTFDGKTFDSTGTCAYIMTQSIPSSDAPRFRVTASNERSSSLQSTSSVRQIIVEVGDDFKLKVSRNLRVTINGKVYNPGSTIQGATIRKIGLFTVIEWDFGLVIRWDGKDRLRVTVWDDLKGKVEGMCGRYNDDMDDDFTMPDGLITNDMNDFVKGWEIKEHSEKKCVVELDDVPDDCNSPDVLSNYQDQCNIVLDTEGPFAKCHRVVDPAPAYRACVNDLCRTDGDMNYKDRVLSSYTHDCLEFSKGPDPWRSDEKMPVKCGANSKYSRCMHQCQPTCGDPDASICKRKLPYLLGDHCVEGCDCLDGFFLSVGKCVPVEKCGCLVDGVYYARGFSYKENEDCTRECKCVGQNIFECKDVDDGCLLSERCNRAAGGYFQCMPGTRRRATCKAITDPHYTSFDGKKFDSQGICSYTMVRSKVSSAIDPFTVVAVNEQPLPNITVSNVKEIHIDYRGQRLSMFKGPVVELNGEVVQTGTSESGMKLMKIGRYMSANFDFGLNVRWDGSDRLRISAMGNLRGQVEGVCGNFNDDPSDDLTNGFTEEVFEEPEEFVNSWRVEGYNDECPSPQADFLVERPVFECGVEEMIQAEQACSVLINPDGPLKNCKRLADAESVYANCMLDMCAFVGDEKMRERVISDYTEDCRQEGGDLDKNWREEANLTDVPCPTNSHFEPCMMQCQPACDDLDGSQCRLSDIGNNCVEGCHPDDGFVLSGDEYVPVSQCGCVKDGRYYKSGDIFYTKECKTLCECNAGIVTCNAAKCGREEECAINGIGKLDCIRIETSTCHAWGSTHFSTFDGNNYDLNTQCHYVIAKREFERGNPRSRLESFVLTANIQPSSDNDKLTVLKNIRLRLPGLGKSMLLKTQAQARVDGRSVYNWRSADEDRMITVDRRGTFTVLKTFFGLEIAFDGSNLRVTLPSRFGGKVRGLCGNFNGDPIDDLNLDDGTLNNDVAAFALDQRGQTCRPPVSLPPLDCSVENEKKFGASDHCGAIMDPNSEFENCSSKLKANEFFEACVHDVCRSGGDKDVLAEALKAYAHECMAIDTPVCNWRKNYQLQIACPVNSHYSGCTKACEETCGTASEKECRHQQVEDCVCDEGYMRSNGHCLPKSTCGGCVVNRKLVPTGFSYRANQCQDKCTCLGNDMNTCEKAEPCITRAKCAKDDDGFQQCTVRSRIRAYCQAFGNGMFSTFDGMRFNTTATCIFTAIKSRKDSTISPFAVKVDLESSNSNSNLSRVAQVFITTNKMDMIMAQDKTVMVNGRNVAIGSTLDEVSIRKFGRFIVAVFQFGLVIRWDGKQSLRIEARQPMSNQMEGLCGDFDENEANDFRTSTGVIETDVPTFVNSWRDAGSDAGCRKQISVPQVCTTELELSQYKDYCSEKYNGNYTSTPRCDLYKYCLYEMCASQGDRESTDNNIHNFYGICKEEPRADHVKNALPPQPELPVVIMHCPTNSHFESCMTECQLTCSDQDATKCKANTFMGDECVPGCQCDDGFVLDGERCVNATDCGCVSNEGEYYPNNFDSYLEDCEKKCQCHNGELSCQKTTCYPGQFCGHKDHTYGCHWENECRYNNGGCDHMCSWVDNQVVCSCRDGYNLTSDMKTCKGTTPVCDKAKKNFTEWKGKTMQVWIDKLDAYMEAMKTGVETGAPAYTCKTVWTEWFDRDDPDHRGDFELLELLKLDHKICDRPVSIEARLRNGSAAYTTGQIFRTFDAEKGLACYNSDQRNGEKCGDFNVRFLCLEELV